VESLGIEKEPNRLSFMGVLFELTAAVLVGRALYAILHVSVQRFMIPFVHGLLGGSRDKILGYSNLFGGTPPFYAEFNGYALLYERVMGVLGTLILAAVVVVLLIAYARRGTQRADAELDVETRVCPECISLIPITARRCAYCRQQVQPQDTPPGTQI
jgi:large conductance mechanosensitive channel